MIKEKLDFFILAGPTASGKSHLAFELAKECGGEIINADSMQVYQDLSILTARPKQETLERIPHHLYGVLSCVEKGSVVWWLEEVSRLIHEVIEKGSFPIIVGGTGLYLHALVHGLSPVPDVLPEIRERVRELCEQLGDGFYKHVADIDPLIKDKLKPGDNQRLCRALEVILQTGESITSWQGRSVPPFSYKYAYGVIEPERQELYKRIDKRFDQMVEEGAVKEAAYLWDKNPPIDSPLLKAIGVQEFKRFFEGEISLVEAIAKAKQNSRRYAKRQMTWFRHQVPKKIVIDDTNLDRLLQRLLNRGDESTK